MSGSPGSTLPWPQPGCVCPRSDVCVCGAKKDAHADIRDEVTLCFQQDRNDVYRYLVHLGCGRTDAQDVAQEAFLRLYRERLDGLRVVNPRAWVFTVARRIAMDRLRRQRLEARLFEELAPNLAETLPDTPDYEEDWNERRRRAELIRALQALSRRERELLMLRAQGHSLQAIGGIVQLPVYAVSRSIQRAIRQLQHQLDEGK